jgi:hypothetical protein
MVYLEYFIDLIFEIYAYFHKKLSFSSSLSEVLIGLVKNIKKKLRIQEMNNRWQIRKNIVEKGMEKRKCCGVRRS